MQPSRRSVLKTVGLTGALLARPAVLRARAYKPGYTRSITTQEATPANNPASPTDHHTPLRLISSAALVEGSEERASHSRALSE